MEKEFIPVLNIDMFPQKLMGFQYPGNLQSFIDTAYKLESQHINEAGSFFEYSMYSIRKFNILQEIKEFSPIKDYINNLVKSLFNINLYIGDSWLNIYKKGGFNPIHSHTSCMLTGVIYLKVPTDHPGLFFHNKFSSLDEKFTVKPSPGSILLFDGNQPHRTLPNPTNEEKIIIAFNLNQAN
jgi:hypothetical protein